MISTKETLLSPSAVEFYGREIRELKLDFQVIKNCGSRLGSNKFLHDQLMAADARLVRIYDFSYESRYTPLPCERGGWKIEQRKTA